MSRGPAFTESELESLNIWDAVDQFSENKPAAGLNRNPKKNPILTVEEIELMQKQAYDEAYAEGIKDGVQQGIEQGQKQGYEQGFEQGKKEGKEQGFKQQVQQLKDKGRQFQQLLETLESPFNQLDETVEQSLVQLAIALARQVIRREIKTDPGQIIAVVREAVQALPVASQKLTLFLHPEDVELVRSTLALDEVSPPWKLIEDPLLTRGGCKLETETSKIDASVENRLAAIIANIMGGERQQDSGNDSPE